MAAGDIAAHFAVTRPAISQHLTILKDARLLSERRDGARRLYRARPEELAELRAFLEAMWPAALERFKAVAEATEAKALRVPADSVEASIGEQERVRHDR
jgi:DNA-binding MarR family transcriptional regulator